MYHIVNGKKLHCEIPSINVFDRGLTLGDGLFETILVRDGNYPLFIRHWQRLQAGAEMLQIPLPFDCLSLQAMINDLIETNQVSKGWGVIRVTLSAGIGARGIISTSKEPTCMITVAPYAPLVADCITATIVNTRRNEYSLASRIKSISYLDNIFAKKEAVAKGFDEAILLNTKGRVAEGATSNVFIVKNNVITTPLVAEGALPGIIRNFIIHDLRIDGIEVIESKISIDKLMDADEIFLTNALMGIKLVHKFDDKVISKFSVSDEVKKYLESFAVCIL